MTTFPYIQTKTLDTALHGYSQVLIKPNKEKPVIFLYICSLVAL